MSKAMYEKRQSTQLSITSYRKNLVYLHREVSQCIEEEKTFSQNCSSIVPVSKSVNTCIKYEQKK